MLRVLYVTAHTLQTRESALLDLMRGIDTLPLPGHSHERYHPVLVLPGEGSLAEAARAAGIETHLIPFIAVPDSTDPLEWVAFGADVLRTKPVFQNLLVDERIQLLHVASPGAAVSATLAARAMQVPAVWTIRRPERIIRNFLTQRFWRYLLRRLPTRVVVPSDRVARQLQGGGVQASAIANGLDIEALQQQGIRGHGTIWREYGIPLRRPLIGCIGLPLPSQGQHTFLSAAARIAAARRDARFLIINLEAPANAAERGYQEDLEQMAHNMGLEEYIIFGGARDDISTLLVDFDILVHCPTQPDPLARPLLEAMALGIPVVASAIGMIPELVPDGEAGLLVPPDDPGALAATVLSLLAPSAGQRRHALATQAKRRTQIEFTLSGMVRRMIRLYDVLLGIARPTTGKQAAVPDETELLSRLGP